MGVKEKKANGDLLQRLTQENYLFRGLDLSSWGGDPAIAVLKTEKLFSNRPIYTAFLPGHDLEHLYVILSEGLVITRSTPLDRIIAIDYPGGCFGMRNLPFDYGVVNWGFPCLVEAYKTTEVIRLPVALVQRFHETLPAFRDRYRRLFELRNKFQYHMLNCSTYPPQAVASLLRALIYQERELNHQPQEMKGHYSFDLPVDVIARACQLNQRTVEQVLKGMQQVKLLKIGEGDQILVLDPEGMKEVYSATRDKVNWWPLR